MRGGLRIEKSLVGIVLVSFFSFFLGFAFLRARKK